jgi:hypothetical protein
VRRPAEVERHPQQGGESERGTSLLAIHDVLSTSSLADPDGVDVPLLRATVLERRSLNYVGGR